MSGRYTARVVREPSFESLEGMTQEAFAEWIERHEPLGVARYELLNGRIVMTPPAGYPHGGLGVRIARAISDHAGDGLVFESSQGYALPSGDTVGPDVTFVSRSRWEAGPKPAVGEFIRIVPDLVVEILSPSTSSRDRGEKKAIYERNGVRELWLVDPRARRIVRFVLADGRFDLGQGFDEDERITSTVLPGLDAPVAGLVTLEP